MLFAAEAARAIVERLVASDIAQNTAGIHPEHRASEYVARRAELTPTSEVEDGEVVWKL